MANGVLLVWLISVLSVASTTVIYLDNETHELITFAHDIAILNKIDPGKFIKLVDCESRWNPKARGDYRIEEDRFMARGILQFWSSTFKSQSLRYNFEGEYENPKDQIILAAKMLKEKEGWRHWTNCWKAISK